ncbi:UPF0725 protein At3g19520-like [Arabidopsis lyrata subsp. lyrata]|uniref:UPF0725 protein At3g19520-like n=1 Tax=Arabidopsis lyrata subsp. lyrata TaxID=81972 RepID=UPI000A29BAF3|nr:UPF0725 protein At3g19520-like [Arabidopsis lyrata subsp. lyrata]|eukprot:XP_020869863.1 UPF0725 protein At3g19520-like [Arabidopsis lyrata subsp. lyrata]
MAIRIEDEGAYFRALSKYWRQVNHSEGFDIEDVSEPHGICGLFRYDCQREDTRYPNPVLVERYARLGLHRYNLSKGTNFQLHHLKKFNMSMNCLSDYYITLAACDPATTSLATFQVKVGENCYGILDLTCYIARPQGTPKESPKPINFGPSYGDGSLPYWPSDFNDILRFTVLKDSELQDNDWIRLYLELALCTNDRWISDSSLSQLQIVRVAIETIGGVVEPPNERLLAKSANVYITFKGLSYARVGEIGEHVERKIIVRRVLDELTGYLTLQGGFGYLFGEEAAVERSMTRSSFAFDDELPPITLPTRPINLHLYKWK